MCGGLNPKQEREATAKPASLLSVAVIIYPEQKQLKEERVPSAYTSRSPVHRWGKSGRELMSRTWRQELQRSVACWFL